MGLPKGKTDKEKNQHIRVMVRCRPLNTSEKTKGGYSVVECNSDQREITVRERLTPTAATKTFTYDKVFSAQSKQIEVYRSAVVPILDEVVQGYNCTIFAYGQTGTGKTYTMEGERSSDPSISWEDDPLSGIVPRAMHQLFTKLSCQDCEFSVRVSYLEIYNEELIDLLGAESVENPRLRIYEDINRKGTHVIQGLEEVVVRSKSEVYDILERGATRRQTAATLMNAHSSRSHTVFMVTVHIKENTVDGEELLKTGKLNLVDLAGSECIGRSGAVDKRAREAGNINQSLLTLGRVITALVEHAPHIPYRESKLTRLLQDSLGGRTKTSIIATISPSSTNLEETLSTLDYAHRAKNITNKPEINQKLTKKALLKEYTEEIERLRRDLQASRDKNGIYLAQENYDDMQTEIAQQLDKIREQEDRIQALTDEMMKLNEIFTDTKLELEERTYDLKVTTEKLEDTTQTLHTTQGVLRRTRRDRDEQKHLVGKHVTTETQLYGEASNLLNTAHETTSDVEGLHAKIERKRKVEEHNESCQERFHKKLKEGVNDMAETLKQFTQQQIAHHDKLQSNLANTLNRKNTEVHELKRELSDLAENVQQQICSIQASQGQHTDEGTSWVRAHQAAIQSTMDTTVGQIEEFKCKSYTSAMESMGQMLSSLSSQLQQLSQTLHSQVEKHKETIQIFATVQEKKLQALHQLMNSQLLEQAKRLDAHKVCMKDMVQSNAELQERLSSELLKRAGEYIMAGLSKFTSEMVEQQKANVQADANKLVQEIDQTQELTTNLHKEALRLVDDTREEELSNKGELKTESTSHHDNADEIVQRLKTDVIELTRKSDNVKENVVTFLGNNQEEWRTHAESVHKSCEVHHTSLNTALQGLANSTEQLTSSFSNHMEKTKSSISQQHELLSSDFRCHGDSVTTNRNNISDWSSNMEGKLKCQQEDVDQFITEDLKKDIPTGLTPQRKEYKYPRNLAKTAPHSAILEEFRKDYDLQEAMQTPIPDDSLNSTSGSQLMPPDLSDGDVDEGLNTSSDSAVSSASRVSVLSENNSSVKDLPIDRKPQLVLEETKDPESKENMPSDQGNMKPPHTMATKAKKPALKTMPANNQRGRTPTSKNPAQERSRSRSNTPRNKTKLPQRPT